LGGGTTAKTKFHKITPVVLRLYNKCDIHIWTYIHSPHMCVCVYVHAQCTFVIIYSLMKIVSYAARFTVLSSIIKKTLVPIFNLSLIYRLKILPNSKLPSNIRDSELYRICSVH
jgi:hypothetical protein